MIENLERLRQSAVFWGALALFAMIFIGLTAASLTGTFLEDYVVQFRLVGIVGMLACFIIGSLVVAVEPLHRLTRYLGEAMAISVRFVRQNVVLVASAALSVLLFIILSGAIGDYLVAAIAVGLALAYCGVTVGILRIVLPRHVPGPFDFFDTFNEGLSRWKSLCRPSAARTVMAFHGRAYCLEMPPYSREKPEIVYVAHLDDFRNGVIECDVYLLSNTLLNILFRADIPGHRYYGARLDTRPQDRSEYRLFNKFLRRDGAHRWFGEAPDLEKKATPNEWHHLRVVVAQNGMELFSDEELVASWADSQYHSGQVGIMAELGVVYIDNFRITRLPSPLRFGQF